MREKTRQNRKRIGPLRIFLCILGGVVAALLLAALVMSIIPLTEMGDPTPVQGSADWMSRLDDALSLDEIVLPGTHDSGTKYVQLGFFSKCQAKDMGQQLEAGYRYLDIRLAVDGDRMKLMHGFTNCRCGAMPWSESLSLDRVLEQCYAFLTAHPTETVIFAVKQEHGDESVTEFETLLNAYVQKNPSFWLGSDQIPTLGEARGKLVLMRRYPDEAGLGANAGIPLLWANQNGYTDVSLNTVSEDNGSYTLWIQDRYEYNAEEKWEAFCSGIETGETGDGNVSLHFLSTKGTAKFGHPFGFAKALNRRLMEKQGLSGWIVVDFASATLAEKIYSVNFH